MTLQPALIFPAVRGLAPAETSASTRSSASARVMSTFPLRPLPGAFPFFGATFPLDSIVNKPRPSANFRASSRPKTRISARVGLSIGTATHFCWRLPGAFQPSPRMA